jgi:hypothetical protein
VIRVELLRPLFSQGDLHWERLAIIRANGRDVTWEEGDSDILSLATPVVDLRNQRQIRYTDDPEEWVRGLSTIFRGGDLVVNVLEDSNPLPAELFESPSDGGESEISLEPARTTTYA